MKVTNIENIKGLFDTIDSCTGRVELVTDEGDRLNLKSKLTQYVSLAEAFSGGQIKEMELVAYDPADIKKLLQFMVDNK